MIDDVNLNDYNGIFVKYIDESIDELDSIEGYNVFVADYNCNLIVEDQESIIDPEYTVRLAIHNNQISTISIYGEEKKEDLNIESV